VFPIELSAIHPSPETAPFWDACRQRQLRLPRCRSCRRYRHPPLPGCPYCGAAATDWVESRGRGRVYSYTIIHHASVPALQPAVPYNVVVVELDDALGARLISNLVGIAHQAIAIGMAVQVQWDEVESGLVLPRFAPA
jgi:uncharacterized OB-fold protein